MTITDTLPATVTFVSASPAQEPVTGTTTVACGLKTCRTAHERHSPHLRHADHARPISVPRHRPQAQTVQLRSQTTQQQQLRQLVNLQSHVRGREHGRHTPQVRSGSWVRQRQQQPSRFQTESLFRTVPDPARMSYRPPDPHSLPSAPCDVLQQLAASYLTVRRGFGLEQHRDTGQTTNSLFVHDH